MGRKNRREKRKNKLVLKPFFDSLEIRWLMRGGAAPWARLHWLSKLEARGDHRFDALYHKLESKFERLHPNRQQAPPAASITAASSPAPTPASTRPVSAAAQSGPTPSPSPTLSPTTDPTPVYRDSLSVGVGSTLDVSIPGQGLSSSDVTYTITPQPLPANMTFNRQTGELVFTPAPDQVGTLNFSILASDGVSQARTLVPITVTSTAGSRGQDSTSLSGRVVDEHGDALADMPVSFGGVSTTTDAKGNFNLSGITSAAAPLSAGGSVATADGRLALTAPALDLLGHDIYAGVDNVIAAPLILPMIDWSSTASIGQQAVSDSPLEITDPALRGFAIRLPSGSSVGAGGSVSLATLSPELSAQHMPQGIRGPMLLTEITGVDLSGPVGLTLPNDQGYQPGAVLNLYLFNMRTGGHDLAGLMTVSADGKTMTSQGPVMLAHATSTDSARASSFSFEPDGATGLPTVTQDCMVVSSKNPGPAPNEPCGCGQPPAKGTASPGNTNPSGGSAYDGSANRGVMDSDAGLVTGEYFQDHQLVTYQSQGLDRGIDLQYSSAQAYPEPVVQYQFTTPLEGDSSSITSITAQVSLGGVVQGGAGATTLTTTSGGQVNVVNEADSPLGAGWSVGGLEQLAQVSSGGPVLRSRPASRGPSASIRSTTPANPTSRTWPSSPAPPRRRCSPMTARGVSRSPARRPRPASWGARPATSTPTASRTSPSSAARPCRSC